MDWRTNILLTSTFFPGVVFLIFFVLNCFVWGEKSSGAVPFGTMFALLVLWFGISMPLVFAGCARPPPTSCPARRTTRRPTSSPASCPTTTACLHPSTLLRHTSCAVRAAAARHTAPRQET